MFANASNNTSPTKDRPPPTKRDQDGRPKVHNTRCHHRGPRLRQKQTTKRGQLASSRVCNARSRALRQIPSQVQQNREKISFSLSVHQRPREADPSFSVLILKVWRLKLPLRIGAAFSESRRSLPAFASPYATRHSPTPLLSLDVRYF